MQVRQKAEQERQRLHSDRDRLEKELEEAREASAQNATATPATTKATFWLPCIRTSAMQQTACQFCGWGMS